MNSRLLGFQPHHRIRGLNVLNTTPRVHASDAWHGLWWCLAFVVVLLALWAFGP